MAVTFVETRKTFIVYPHLGIKEEVEEEVFVTVEDRKEEEKGGIAECIRD